jgi:hypothetical protein
VNFCIENAIKSICAAYCGSSWISIAIQQLINSFASLENNSWKNSIDIQMNSTVFMLTMGNTWYFVHARCKKCAITQQITHFIIGLTGKKQQIRDDRKMNFCDIFHDIDNFVAEPSEPELYYRSVASGMVHGVTCMLLLVATFAHRGMSQPLGQVIDGILGPEMVARVQEVIGELQLDTLVSMLLSIF